MKRQRVYTETEKTLALIFLEKLKGDFKRAAKLASVEEIALRVWHRELHQPEGEAEPEEEPEPLLLARPFPPEHFLAEERWPELVAPAPDVAAWYRAMFIDEGAPFENEDHWHLRDATIGVVWTNVPLMRGGSVVVGQAEIPLARQKNKWAAAREALQLREWFGDVPDFLITLDAPACGTASTGTFCSIGEHELYHCAVKINPMTGEPRTDKEGNIQYTMRGHEVEEFVGCVRRYGVGHAAGKTAELVEAANRRPLFSDVDVETICGTCQRRQ